MERVRADAKDVGNPAIEARALTALSEVALLRNSDVDEARRLAQAALETVDPEDHTGRFDALDVLENTGRWTGNTGESERYARDMLETARRSGRLDLESRAATQLGSVRGFRGDPEGAAELFAQARALAEKSGSNIALATVLLASGDLQANQGNLAVAEAELTQAVDLFTEYGNANGIGRARLHLARAVWKLRDSKRAERLFRDAIAVLKPLEDRGTLCEAQRGLAELFLERGNIDEAEKYALHARETVGAQDITSLSSTAYTLGRVRAAQGRDEEAEALLREAIERVEGADRADFWREPLTALAQFLRERGREDEAAAVEGRAEERTRSESTAEIA